MNNNIYDIVSEHMDDEAKAELDKMAREVLDDCMKEGILADFFASKPDAIDIIKKEIFFMGLADAEDMDEGDNHE